MLVRTQFELEIEPGEYDEMIRQAMMAMGQTIERIGKFHLGEMTPEEFQQIAVAAVGVAVTTVFGKRVSVTPPFEIQVDGRMIS